MEEVEDERKGYWTWWKRLPFRILKMKRWRKVIRNKIHQWSWNWNWNWNWCNLKWKSRTIFILAAILFAFQLIISFSFFFSLPESSLSPSLLSASFSSAPSASSSTSFANTSMIHLDALVHSPPSLLSKTTLLSSASQPPSNLSAYLLKFSELGYQPYQPPDPMNPTWGGCPEIAEFLSLPGSPRKLVSGTVKDVFLGKWTKTMMKVAILRLKSSELNGDFSSGISRLIAFQGHPNIVPLIGVCPAWTHFVSFDSSEYTSILEDIQAAGHTRFFNTIVTPFADYGDLENIDLALEAQGNSDNWIQRLRLAIDYARVMCFLHNSGEEKNPFDTPLVQKDRKISQFLIGNDLKLQLNDVEAIPPATDEEDMREDIAFMKPVLMKIFGSANLPPKLNQALQDIYFESEDPKNPWDFSHQVLQILLSFT